MAKTSATSRVGRILSLVPWIASHDGPTIDEVCARFDIARDQLESDLNAVLVVGLHPYTPGDYIDVWWDADEFAAASRVWIGFTNFFELPLRLTLHEALALLAAGVAAREQPGHDADGPLARGLGKVADLVGVDVDGDLAVRLPPEAAATHGRLSAAIEECRVVGMTYYSHARDETTVRDVEPRRLFTTGGAAYLDAFCRSSDDDRVFRLDRITDLAIRDEEFTPRPEDDAGDDVGPVFDPGEEVPRVTLDVPESARWIVETVPAEITDQTDDRLRITMAVAATPWLERLLLRLGPDARVVDGPDELRHAGRDAARRLLERMGR